MKLVLAAAAAVFATSFFSELFTRKKQAHHLHDALDQFRQGFSEGYRSQGLTGRDDSK
jgi:hypothetical protein